MKVLITGSNGMLGKDMTKAISTNFKTINTNRDECDITNLNQVQECLNKFKPDIVINCAAYTDVDGCESNQEMAFSVNTVGPRNLAIVSNQIGAKLVHISTDYVFDGDKHTGYREFDSTNPINIYGASKLAGENHIRDLCNQFYIVRTSWLFGAHGKNFIKTMLALSESHEELNVVDDQIGSPTYTKDLATAIAKLIQKPSYGTFHITNSDTCSWYQFTKDIMEIADKDIKINPVKSSEFKRKAKRPNYSVLNNYMWSLEGHKAMRTYKEALKEYIITDMEVQK